MQPVKQENINLYTKISKFEFWYKYYTHVYDWLPTKE